MRKRLPSLKALRAFEAAARHLKFLKAAEELHVTPGAVTQQIKILEKDLRVTLFRRSGRDMVLTDAGHMLFAGVHEAFELITGTVADVLKFENHGILSITLGPGFAIKWLVPRLYRFQELQPDIDVRLSMQHEPIKLEMLQTDLAIRFGDGDYPGCQVDRLFKEQFIPMCSPKLLEGPHPLRTPNDLKHHTLLRTYAQNNKKNLLDWEEWLRFAGVEDVDPNKGLYLTTVDLAIQAAIDGAGVALGFCTLAKADIRAGRLVLPFPIEAPSDRAYYLACPLDTANRPKIVAFREWMLDEIARDTDATT